MEILGIPPGTTVATPKVPFAADATQAVFSVQIPAETRAGNYKTIVCRATITNDKGIITQTNGNGEVQIDVPITPPMPATAVAAAPAAPAAPTTPAAPTAKPLTRLEQLKQQRGK
jgi:hypothetical protein